MSRASEAAYSRYIESVGSVDGTSDWFCIDQARINSFADATLDFTGIHVDPQAAEIGPFGETIAHGFLTLSLLPFLTQGFTETPERNEGSTGGVNYGFNKVRFVSPVRVNSRIRASVTLIDVSLKGDQIEITRDVTVEIDGLDRPALLAEWIVRTFY